MIHLTSNDTLTQFVEYEALQRTLNRASAELRIIALMSDIVYRIIGNAQVYSTLHEHLMYTLNLQSNNIADLALIERSEHYRLVNTVEELRANRLFQQLHHLLARLLVVNALLLILADELAAEVRSEEIAA